MMAFTTRQKAHFLVGVLCIIGTVIILPFSKLTDPSVTMNNSKIGIPFKYIGYFSLSVGAVLLLLAMFGSFIPRIENRFCRVFLKMIWFLCSTSVGYLAIRVGIHAFGHHHDSEKHGHLSFVVGELKAVLDLSFGDEKEVAKLLFADVPTVIVIIIYSVLAICLGRVTYYPEPFYALHELLLQLACLLAADYFGAQMLWTAVIFAICAIIVGLKEVTEGIPNLEDVGSARMNI